MDGKLDWDMKGKIVIVTGANSGIGKATAAQIADLGASVVLACRNKERGECAANDLACVPGRDITLMRLDLSDLESVRAFAAAFTRAVRPSGRAHQQRGHPCPPPCGDEAGL